MSGGGFRDGLRKCLYVLVLFARPALAQQIDMSHGGPVDVTARDGIELRQNDQEVIAHGDARAVRDNVTVTADELIAHYRKKAGAGATPAAAVPNAALPTSAVPTAAVPTAAVPTAAVPGATPSAATDDTGANEIYRLEAIGNVHIFTATDQAFGDHAVYDMDQAVLVMTGHNLKVITPEDVMTARDSLEYWSVPRRSVGRGNALVVTSDGRRIAADTLVGYSVDPNAHPPGAPPAKPSANAATDPLAASGKLERVEAYGNVNVRTATETVYGERGVYLPDTGIARIVGHVRVTRGQNQLNGVAADVNMKTGVSTMLSGPAQRVEGLIVPNDTQGNDKTGPVGAAKPAKPVKPQ